MILRNQTGWYRKVSTGLSLLGAAAIGASIGLAFAEDTLPNACPVDGCLIKIVGVKKAGNELELALEANFKPDMSKNHVHVWWGENYKIEQVTNNAETVYKVKQGDWHPTDEYPTYTTTSAASTTVRGDAKTLCVSAADRNHDILDVKLFQCVDVSEHL